MGRYLLERLGEAFYISIVLRALGWREGKGQEMAGQLTTDSWKPVGQRGRPGA